MVHCGRERAATDHCGAMLPGVVLVRVTRAQAKAKALLVAAAAGDDAKVEPSFTLCNEP